MKKMLNTFLAAAVSVGSISCGYPDASTEVAAAPESVQQGLDSAGGEQRPPDAGDPDAIKLRKYSLACALQFYNTLGGPLNFTSTPVVMKPYGEYDKIVVQDGDFRGGVIPVFFRAPEGGFKKALRAVGGRLNHAPGNGQAGTQLFSLNQLQPSESPKIDALLVGGFFAPFERQGKLFNAAQFSCDLVDTHGQDGASISAALQARGLERAEEMKRQFEAEAQ